MIVSKTPLRVSFIGGGSDLASYYKKYGGAVISTSIKKYIYINVNKRFDSTIRLSYSITEQVNSVEDIKHRLVQAALIKLNISSGVEITSIADIPSRGTGLGSSSAFTVGLLNALYAYKHDYKSKNNLAAEACDVEINICKEPIGKQDQYATALGGMNLIKFNQDETVVIEPVIFPPGFKKKFEESMLLVYTGIVRSASDMLQKQEKINSMHDEKSQIVSNLTGLVEEFKNAILAEDIKNIGAILHESWNMKKSISSDISSAVIDDIYKTAIQQGAYGGKLLGAGGGGFVLLCADKSRHASIVSSLGKYRVLPFEMESSGSSLVYYEN
jgi:D-glycero-alpha-D-manno-heptose-7-phosphate kinase